MKKELRLKITSGFIIMALALFATSCSSDEGNVFETPNEPEQENPEEPEIEVATLVFNEGDPSNDIFVANASGEVGTSVPGRVIFTSTATTQKRMYITQNVSGGGDMPFNNFDLGDTDLKKALKVDGSIDLDGASKKEIDFTFELPVPDIDNGEIVYSFWTTKGKGDFRDALKRKAMGVGTITVKVGNGTNPAAEVRSFTNIKLFAPAEDGTTKTFFSLLNETVYQINEGPEFRAFWDFGYYYKNNQAAFASTADYDAAFGFPVEGLKPGAGEEDMESETLNEAFFELSTMTATQFEGLTLSGELDAITKSTFQNYMNLVEGDVIEFVDNYGKKGLIKITEIEAGFNVNDFIVFDVKIQP